MRTEQEEADYYGLTLEQLRDVKEADGRSTLLFAYFLKYPEPTWQRMIAAARDLRSMTP